MDRSLLTKPRQAKLHHCRIVHWDQRLQKLEDSIGALAANLQQLTGGAPPGLERPPALRKSGACPSTAPRVHFAPETQADPDVVQAARKCWHPRGSDSRDVSPCCSRSKSAPRFPFTRFQVEFEGQEVQECPFRERGRRRRDRGRSRRLFRGSAAIGESSDKTHRDSRPSFEAKKARHFPREPSRRMWFSKFSRRRCRSWQEVCSCTS